MPTVTIDAYLCHREERADLDYGMPEWGTNRFGKPSHASRPGDGAQYDSTRNKVFCWGGLEQDPHGLWMMQLRRLRDMAMEGPHETALVMIFKPPVGSVVLSDARVILSAGVISSTVDTNGQTPLRIYAAAEDDYCTRFVGTAYRDCYKGEFEQVIYGEWSRRYRSSSTHADKEHTATEVIFDAQALGWADQPRGTSPNLAAMLNEILARPGWKQGNKIAIWLGLSRGMDNVPSENDKQRVTPDWMFYGSANEVTYSYDYPLVNSDSPRPQLSLTY